MVQSYDLPNTAFGLVLIFAIVGLVAFLVILFTTLGYEEEWNGLALSASGACLLCLFGGFYLTVDNYMGARDEVVTEVQKDHADFSKAKIKSWIGLDDGESRYIPGYEVERAGGKLVITKLEEGE